MGSEQTAKAFAKYHDERAGYGDVSREFHERTASFLRTQDAEVAALRQRVEELTANLDRACKALADLEAVLDP